jgi:hypothetical protein
LWFDSTDAIRAAGESVIGQSVFADERNFIEDSGTRLFLLCSERVVA